MANTLGSLIVKLGLDAAEFVDGLTKSEYRAQKFAANLSNQIATGVLKAEIALKALGLAAQFAIRAFPELTGQAGHFQDISERIGDTAENVASLAVAAKVAGTDVDSLADFSAKLQKNLTLAGDAGSKTGAVLKALGINAKDFKQLGAADQFEALAKALAGFKEQGKTAALEDLVRGGSQLLPFLKELGEGVGRVNILTSEQIRLADEWSDKHAKSRAELNLYAQALATQFILPMTAAEGAITDVIKQLLGLDKAATDLKGNTAVSEFTDSTVTGLRFIIDSADSAVRVIRALGIGLASTASIATLVAHGEGRAAVEAARSARADLAKLLDTPLLGSALEENYRRRLAEGSAPKSTGDFARADRKGSKPSIPYTGVDENAGEVLKKLLDGQIKAVRDFLQEQRAQYEFANQYLKGVYDDGLTSLADFFEKQKALRDADIEAQVRALDKEIAALQDYKSKALKPQERLDADNKIAEATRKRADIVSDAGRKEILANQANARAVRELNDSYNEFKATILELSGDNYGAALIRIAKTVRDTKEQLTKRGAGTGEADEQERLLKGQADRNELQRQYDVLLQETKNKEEEITLAAQLGGKSELETLKEIGSIRGSSLDVLGQLADRARALSQAFPTNDALRLWADGMALGFKKAAAEVEPLLGKIQDTGKEIGGTIANGIEDWITGAKSLRQVLASIEQDILRIMTRKLVTEPLGNWLSNLIGGNGAPSGGGGLLGGIFKSLFGGGGSSLQAAFSQTALGASGFGTGLAFGNQDFGGFLAGGGPADSGKFYRVNERGPEMLDVNGQQFLMMGSQRGRVTPLGQSMGGGMAVTINQSFAPGTDRRTINHAAQEVNRVLATVQRRGG